MSSRNNCLICGAPLEYLTAQEEMTCSICGATDMSNARCSKGHFVCDTCHQKRGIRAIRELCKKETSKDPIVIIQKIMEDPYIYMHGPEHHIMVGASLLTAYKNAGAKVDFESVLEEMIQRGSQVPGGICGFWGCCGAAVSSGIFMSLIFSATPLSSKGWALANEMTSKALVRIAEYGGPRCCKRDSFLTILSAEDFLEEHTGIKLECSGRVYCSFSEENTECIREKCPFYHDTENIYCCCDNNIVTKNKVKLRVKGV